jgi:hypothetical protein
MIKTRRANEWSDAHKKYVADNWAKMSAGEIARVLGKTRNAIIGMVSRMKLPKKRLVAAVKHHHARKRILKEMDRKPEAAVVKKTRGPLPLWLTKSQEAGAPSGCGTMRLMDLKDKSCRYPYGDHAPFLFCGRTVAHGSWCEGHASVIFNRNRLEKQNDQPDSNRQDHGS